MSVTTINVFSKKLYYLKPIIFPFNYKKAFIKKCDKSKYYYPVIVMFTFQNVIYDYLYLHLEIFIHTKLIFTFIFVTNKKNT